MYARGTSNREIYNQMQELYGVKISADMVTAITNKIIPQIKEWQIGPLDEVYPVVFGDATYFYVKDNVSTFFKYSSAIRKNIYTTNSIESLNNSYKRINKSRRVYPSVQSLENICI